jgi:hypothetical protein
MSFRSAIEIVPIGLTIKGPCSYSSGRSISHDLGWGVLMVSGGEAEVLKEGLKDIRYFCLLCSAVLG